MLLTPFLADADGALLVKPALQQEPEESCKRYQSQDAHMNDLYQQIETQYAGDKKKIRRLQKAQKSWLRFRDSHLELLFPVSGQTSDRYASITPMCRCDELAALTQTRNAQLAALMNPQEGDVCATN